MRAPVAALAALLACLATAACQDECDHQCASAQAVTLGPLATRLADEFSQHYRDLEATTYDALRDQHRLDYARGLDFDVREAAYYQQFVETFNLSASAAGILHKLGFVVIPSPARAASEHGYTPTGAAGPADVFYRVFAADLPVFVSADSILHAWHRSFDKLLESSETYLMIPALEDLLSKTSAELAGNTADAHDALFYLSVAQILLQPIWEAPSQVRNLRVAQTLLQPIWEAPSQVRNEVDRFVELINSKTLVQTDFMGSPTSIDFSQFIARGHYTRSAELERYFMAMMWLGRTDLLLYQTNPNAEPRPREEAAARAIARAMQVSGATEPFERMNRLYSAFVGRTNAMTPLALLELCTQSGLDDCRGDQADMLAAYARQDPPEYSSRVFASATPPITMRFFPQRFGYGSWVTSQTTTPRLEPGGPGGRSMAMPEDVAFALGSSRAIEYFADDMRKPMRENLPATLEAVRLTVEAVPPAELDPTAHNHWLEALKALSKPTLDKALPQVMRTAAWHDHKLEAVLASWAELRHDTILIVEQSTGGFACEYPKGFVEPVPGLYRSLSRSAAALAGVYGDLPVQTPLAQAGAFLEQFEKTMETLARLAELEIAHKPMDESDLAFLNRTVDTHRLGYAGRRSFDGWYPQLFWTVGWAPDQINTSSGISEPIVADVHTDAENQEALEVAVGHPGMMIIAMDSDGDLSLYGGPVASYYSFAVPLDQRMTDEQWNARIDSNDLPARPPFAQSYWAD